MSYTNKNGKLLRPSSGSKYCGAFTRSKNRKLLDNYTNDIIDATSTRPKIPAELYDKATKSILSNRVQAVQNNSVQKYMTGLKPKAQRNFDRLDQSP